MSGLVMAGSTADFDVPSILQAVSLSRQCTVLRLWDRDKNDSGEIQIKAGQLLNAKAGAKTGRAALHSVLSSKAHHTFRVERVADASNLPEPVGPLASLLLELPRSIEPEPEPAQTGQTVVGPAPTRPAKTKRPVPPPVARPAARPTKTRPAPRIVRSEPILAAVPQALAEEFATYRALEGVVVCKLPECLECLSWERAPGSMSAESVAAYVGQLVRATQALKGGKAPVELTLDVELDEGCVSVRHGGADIVVAYRFAPGTPLGLTRLVVTRAHTSTTETFFSDVVGGAGTV